MDVSLTGGWWRNTGDGERGDENNSILNVLKKNAELVSMKLQDRLLLKEALIFLFENIK